MSRREELKRIRAELAAARQRTLSGHGLPTEAQPLLDVAARRIADVSPAWRDVIVADPSSTLLPRSPRGMSRELALGIELIYEGWSLHAGDSRLTTLTDEDESLALLIGDWCYAAGLCEVADAGDLRAVQRLAALVADLSARAEDDAASLEACWDETLAAFSGS